MPIPIWAGHYIGLPFTEHGRNIHGLDCWGLVRLIMAEQFNIALPSYSRDYQSTKDQDRLGTLITGEAKKWIEIPKGKEQQGDVIVLRMRGQPMHVGLVLGDAHMIHIERGINSAIERYSSIRWKDRVWAVYRYNLS